MIAKFLQRAFRSGSHLLNPVIFRLGSETNGIPRSLKVQQQLKIIQHDKLRLSIPLNSANLVEKQIKCSDLEDFLGSAISCVKLERLNNKKSVSESGALTANETWHRLILPFGESHQLRKRFTRFETDTLRFGKMIYLTQIFTEYISNFNLFDKTCKIHFYAISDIDIFHDLKSQQNVFISIYMTYADDKYLVMKCDIYQENDQKEGATDPETKESDQRLAISANYIMRISGQPKIIPKLSLENEDTKSSIRVRYDLARDYIRRLEEQRKKALKNSPPSHKQMEHLHQIFMRKQGPQSRSYRIQDTLLEKCLALHLQDKTDVHEIQAGYLYREAYELGFLTAYSFCLDTHDLQNNFEKLAVSTNEPERKNEAKTQNLDGKKEGQLPWDIKVSMYPQLLQVNDWFYEGNFTTGNIIKFEGQVGYVKDNIIHVVVKCSERQGTTINELQDLDITFLAKNSNKIPIEVYPVSYEESMVYLQSKKAVDALKQ